MTAGRRIVGHNHDWGTPKKYVDAVKEVFGGSIDLDPCSNSYSIVGARLAYCLPERDGLKESWDYPTIYVNPPYGIDHQQGTTIKDWLKRCEEAHAIGSEVLALVPVATNTGHWKKYVYGKATAICFLYDTRLRFLVNGKDEGKGAPMSCAMIYWGKNFDKFSKTFMQFGAVINIENLKGVEIGRASENNHASKQRKPLYVICFTDSDGTHGYLSQNGSVILYDKKTAASEASMLSDTFADYKIEIVPETQADKSKKVNLRQLSR